MKAQPLSQELLDELTELDECVLLSEFNQRRYLMKCEKVISVDAAEGYMCKGVVFALSNNYEKMVENFQIAMRLASNDVLIKSNYISSLCNYGQFNSVLELLGKYGDPRNPVQHRAFYRSIISTFNLEVLRELDSDYVNNIYASLEFLNLDYEDVKNYIFLFNSILVQNNARFGIVPSISWVEEEGELFVYYDYVGSANDAIKIMDELDKKAVEKGLRHVNRKLTIILLPNSIC